MLWSREYGNRILSLYLKLQKYSGLDKRWFDDDWHFHLVDKDDISSLKEEAMKDYSTYAATFKALSDETRLQILEMIGHGEPCACELQEYFQVRQPTLSYHMKVLTDCGLVHCRRDGKRMLYKIAPEWEGFLACLHKDMLKNQTVPPEQRKEVV